MTSNQKIQSFSDYRTFLHAHAQDMKRAKSFWSYGLWAKSLHLKSTSSITKIIRGQREPGPEITEKLVKYFRFDHKQAKYFKDLVQLQKVKKDPRLSLLLMEKIEKQNPDSSFRLIDDKTFMIISNWYYLALRELSGLPSFREDPEWIAKQFVSKVTATDIKRALRILEEVGLLSRNSNGRLKIVEKRLDTSNDIASEAIKRYHEQMLEHAKSSLRRVDVNQREITATTLSINSKKIGIAKELIREFKLKFEEIMEEDKADSVYQFQIQFFPLTQDFTKKEIL